jgi:aminopeptidase N
MVVGDETFFDVLSNFFNEYKFKLARIDDFIRTAENTSGQELDWFFNEWLYMPGYTIYAIENVQTSKTWLGKFKLTLNISQSNPSFKMPLPLEIRLSNNMTKLVRIWIEDKYQTFTFQLDSKPLYLILDPQDVILGIDKNNEKDLKMPS